MVLIPAELRDYDAASGNLLRRWPLPAAQSGGYCGRVFCGATDVVLAGAGRASLRTPSRAVCTFSTFATGTDRRIADALAARLTPAGIFYVYTGAAPWPGADPFRAARGFALALRDARFECGGDRVAHRCELDAVEHVLEEAAHDQALGFRPREARVTSGRRAARGRRG